MQKLSILFGLIVFLSGYDESILKQSKIDVFNASKEMIILQQKIQNYSLIAKPIISYGVNKSDALSNKSDTNDILNIKLEQDIFKSGGIYYSIKQANAIKNMSLEKLGLNKRKDIFRAYKLSISLKKLDLSIQKQKLLIENKNKKIDSLKSKYKRGLSSISAISTNLIELNIIENALYVMRDSKISIMNNLLSISSKSYKDIKLWKLNENISQDDFIKNNNFIKVSELDIYQKEYTAKNTITKYLPKVSVFANYSNKNTQISYGLNVSWMLNISSMSGVEYARLDTIKSVIAKNETLEYEKRIFNVFRQEMSNINNKIKNSKNNIRHYDLLFKDIKSKYKQQLSSKIDLEIMSNTRDISRIDFDIFVLDKHLKITNIYERFSQ